jgi:outer membrane protein assembly factor BamE (lipoprotein component of BamABCDE complex)
MRRAVIALALSLAGSGCSLALGPPSPPDPRFARQHLASLTSGMTQDAVRGVLGEPLRARSNGARVHWQYEHKQYLRGCATRVFGLTVNEQPHEVRLLDLSFDAGALTAARLTERLLDRTVRVRLVPASSSP